MPPRGAAAAVLPRDAQHSWRVVSGLPVLNSLCYYLLLSQSCVAQRQSIRLLIGRLLVRIQSQELAAPDPQGRGLLRVRAVASRSALARWVGRVTAPSYRDRDRWVGAVRWNQLRRIAPTAMPGADPRPPCDVLSPTCLTGRLDREGDHEGDEDDRLHGGGRVGQSRGELAADRGFFYVLPATRRRHADAGSKM